MGSINLAVACSSLRRGWARGSGVGHYGARPAAKLNAWVGELPSTALRDATAGGSPFRD